MDFIDYREKLGIGFCDEEKFTYFLSRFFSKLEEPTKVPMSVRLIPPKDYRAFCDLVGVPIDFAILGADPIQDLERFRFCIKILKEHSTNFLDFLSYVISFVNSIGTRPKMTSTFNREHYADMVITALNSAHIPYELLMDNDEYFIFPKGVSEFDDVLVSQPLEWLQKYPVARTAWIKALKEYAPSTEENASDVADKFRKALEAFFQEFFGGQKSLENYKSDYGKYLKEQGIPKEISGNFETLLQSYTQFINNYAKHRDATSDKVLEYIMYQTGNIIRLLITLQQEETTDAN